MNALTNKIAADRTKNGCVALFMEREPLYLELVTPLNRKNLNSGEDSAHYFSEQKFFSKISSK